MISNTKFEFVTQSLVDMFCNSHKGYYITALKNERQIAIKNTNNNSELLITIIDCVGTFVTVKIKGMIHNVTLYQLNSRVFNQIGHN